MHKLSKTLQQRCSKVNRLVLAGLAWGAMGIAASASATPFTFAESGVYGQYGEQIGLVLSDQSQSGGVSVLAGAVPTAYARSRAIFGANGLDYGVATGASREVAGASVWSDGFTIVGQSGSVSVSTRLRGNIAGESDLGYWLFVSATPFDLAALIALAESDGIDDSDPQLPNAQRVFFTAYVHGCGTVRPSEDCGRGLIENYQGAVDVPLLGSIAYTDGQPFHLLSVLVGEVDDLGGGLQFNNSADFGLTVPASATLQTLSGFKYAGAVPEPASWALMLAGLGVFAGLAQRARRRCPAQSTSEA